MILVDAIYTNQSGSKRLLEYWVKTLAERGLLADYFFLLDQRIESDALSIISPENYVVLTPNEKGRWEYYRLMPSAISTIFCFGSVPPPIKIHDRRVIILQHNPFFFESPGYPLSLKALYLVKRLYIWSRCLPGYAWVVQTPRMKSLVVSKLGVHPEQISVLPFFEIGFFEDFSDRALVPPLRFVYPADGVPQKNHSFLFRVWERLYREHGIAPELHVTLPEKYTLHLDSIRKLQQKGVNIINHGFVSKMEMKALYKDAHFLVFPSLSESFGLPLAEAAITGLRVIGANLPYLFQVVEPSGIFNPRNEDSLIKIIADLHMGIVLPQTKVVLKDRISELIELVQGKR